MKQYFFAVIAGLCISAVQTAEAQNRLFNTSTGQTHFSASTPLEDIEADNKKSQAILNATTGDIAVRMNMKDFVFPNKLMQEHFNENYIESDKYPTATFSGKIDNAPDLSKDGNYDVSATGKFTVHGVAKDKTIRGKLSLSGGKIELKSEFTVALTDHKIEVPQVVFVKIAQTIKVNATYSLVLKK